MQSNHPQRLGRQLQQRAKCFRLRNIQPDGQGRSNGHLHNPFTHFARMSESVKAICVPAQA